MRRLALSVFTVCGLALLTACGTTGGTGFSSNGGNGSIDSVLFTNNSAQTNDFFVQGTGAVAPLQITAIGQKGSGTTALQVPDATFTWAGRFVDPTTDLAANSTYTVGPAPSGSRNCPKLPAGGTPPVVILQQNPPVQPTPVPAGQPTPVPTVAPAYIPLPATQPSNTVFISAVAGVTPPYCLLIVASHVGDGTIGTKVVLVTNGVP